VTSSHIESLRCHAFGMVLAELAVLVVLAAQLCWGLISRSWGGSWERNGGLTSSYHKMM
jgi:hypothetical protein